ncbi:M3 family metallopeptidase [Alteribacter natronophilus]|uniref:M3 family metallopeptidase n=1 Tax=Alteribacter natronophilus TaxID=2583810 RepID=UPI00110D9CAD|nr:M3 family metallopeptidase [Alteribacter natronophilus]TMW71219.1 M3 family oligoendopeptidase [Alteribacter natronophilus]
MNIAAPTRWDLTDLLPCDPDTQEFRIHINSLREKLSVLEAAEESALLNEIELNKLARLIQQVESAESFYYCLTTEEEDRSFLSPLLTSISELKSRIRLLVSNQKKIISQMGEEQFADWSSRMTQKSFIRNLTEGTEPKSSSGKIISGFAAETLSSMEDIYGQVRNNLRVKAEAEGEKTELSFAEASHSALSHPVPSTRNQIFSELNRTLEKQAGIFASIYNSMAGLRLNENKVKNADTLEASLKINGISKPVLDAMWNAVDDSLPEVSKYLHTKARESGKERISWHDLMTSTQATPHTIPFPQAVEGISEALAPIDSNTGEFIKNVIMRGWVDAEPRETKPPGGFCAPFMQESESRISINYDESIDSARRLAHELGHAWHFKQMKNAASLVFSDETFEMTTAETASVFFETAYIDYVIENTGDSSVRKAMLGAKIERTLNYLMAIRGAFLFESRFYECRENGPLDASQIEELSIQAQKEAYGYGLSEYEPFIWIKYVQFYQANIPFYNYPYSLGFLLSIGLLEHAKKESLFSGKYQRFLSETGLLPLEQLVKKHFSINLSHPEFWQQSIQRINQDIEQYIVL